MRRQVLALLVRNTSGVLSRVSGLFSRRGYNIDSLTVGETENPEYSRITVVAKGDDRILTQIKKQLEKLADVVHISEMPEGESVFRELALVKVISNQKTRPSIIEIAGVFRAIIVDVSSDSLMIQVTGDQRKIEAFIDLMRDFGIIEVVKTGITGLQRGRNVIKLPETNRGEENETVRSKDTD